MSGGLQGLMADDAGLFLLWLHLQGLKDVYSHDYSCPHPTPPISSSTTVPLRCEATLPRLCRANAG